MEHRCEYCSTGFFRLIEGGRPLPLDGDMYLEGGLPKIKIGADVKTFGWANGGGGSPTRFITFKIDGGEVPAQPGFEDFIPVEFDGNIIAWEILAAGDTPGDIKIDIWKCAYDDYPPSDFDSICGGHEPEITDAVKGLDVGLEDWDDTTLAEGDTLVFHVDSADRIKKMILMLIVEPL